MKKAALIIAAILAFGLTISVIAAVIAAAPEKSSPQALQPEAQTAVPASALPEAPAQTTLVFSGDVMLSRVVSQKMEKYGDWSWPFRSVASEMSAADLAIINLESPFTEGGSHLVKTGSFSFNADPRSIAGLKLAGIDIAALANNHMTNQGRKGVSDTKRILAAGGIASIGAGLDAAEAAEPVVKEINGIRFGFLSFAYPADQSVAGSSTAGIAGMDVAKMEAEIGKLESRADKIIILMHAGTEYVSKPNWQQTGFARAAIDAGADMVVGHHPHWVQTTEIYKGRPIIYSLGNLVFDQMWSQETREGALAKAIWNGKELKSIEFIPVIISDYGQAAAMTSTPDKSRVLKRMGLESGMIAF